MFVRIHTVNSPFVTAFHITYILYNEHTTRNILVSPIQNDTDVQTEVRTHCPGPITFISLQSTTKVEKIFWASPAGRKLSFLGGGISPQEMSRWNTGIRVCVCVCHRTEPRACRQQPALLQAVISRHDSAAAAAVLRWCRWWAGEPTSNGHVQSVSRVPALWTTVSWWTDSCACLSMCVYCQQYKKWHPL